MENADLVKIFKPYLDGLITAKNAMYKLVSVEANGRDQLKAIAFDWLENKLTSKQAADKIIKAYNIN